MSERTKYNPSEARMDESLVRDVVGEMPRFLKEVRGENKDLPQSEVFKEARRRVFRYLRVPGELWGEFAAAVSAKMGAEKVKEPPRRRAVAKKPGVFGHRTTESLIRESLGVIRARGGDPDDEDEE